MRTSLLLLFFLCLPYARAQTSSSSTDAVVIMRSMVAAYGSLSSYRDSGQSLQTLGGSLDNPDSKVSTIRFKTLFERPDRYSFAWTHENDFDGKRTEVSRNCFWSDGSRGWDADQYHGGKTRISEVNLRAASAATTGISQGTSHDIFRLLSNRVSGFRYDELRDLHVIRSEILTHIDNYVVRGRYYDSSSVDLWIGKQDYFIREGVLTWLDGATTTFTRSDIVVNSYIAESEFDECGTRFGKRSNAGG